MTRKRVINGFLFYCLIVISIQISITENVNKKDTLKAERLPECQACRAVVDSFKKGMERTARFKFEGGDASWEEEKQLKYAQSEVRLTEIQEEICKDTLKGQDQCHLLASEYDDLLEQWWFKEQKTNLDLYEWLCINAVKVCCPENTHGPECEPCPGGIAKPCSGNGKCRGAGTRKGAGECRCVRGYSGKTCEKCSTGFYQTSKEDEALTCGECHKACKGHCRDGTSKGCEVCLDGWLNHPELGCQDIDECVGKHDTPLCLPNQFCVNTEGSYTCLECHSSCDTCFGHAPDECIQCKTGFTKKNNLCLDSDAWWRNIHTQWGRYFTYFGLCLATCIIFKKSTIIASIVGVAVATYIGLSEYMVSDNSLATQGIRFLPTSSE